MTKWMFVSKALCLSDLAISCKGMWNCEREQWIGTRRQKCWLLCQ